MDCIDVDAYALLHAKDNDPEDQMSNLEFYIHNEHYIDIYDTTDEVLIYKPPVTVM